jgi:hypothetical protein
MRVRRVIHEIWPIAGLFVYLVEVHDICVELQRVTAHVLETVTHRGRIEGSHRGS